jgi:RNA polymerase sigma factor (sigma-70 family)
LRTKALHDQYAQPIFNYCLRRLRSREEAEDAAQIVFLNAHRCLEEGVQPQSERAWLFKIAEHVVMYRRRTISRRARVEFPIDVDSLADLVVAPGREVPSELDALPEALARIPEAQQRAIVLREWYGLSYREVAAELGISASAAETLIFRARRRLAQELGGPPPTTRRRTPLSLASPVLPLSRWLFGGTTALKAIAGVTSVAVIAVGTTKVGLLERPPPRAAMPSAPQRVVAQPAAHAQRTVFRLQVPAAAARSHVRAAGARAPRRAAPIASAHAPAPVVVVTADPVEAVAPADPVDTEAVVAAETAAAPAEDVRSEAVVDTAPVADLPVAAAQVEQPATVEPTADVGEPVDPTASDPGKSDDPHGPNQMATFGQEQRSAHASANAADPGSNGNGAGSQSGNALPQPSNDGAPDLSALPGTATVPDAPVSDPSAAPGNSGSAGEPADPGAQGESADPAAHDSSEPHGNSGNGPPQRDIHGLGSAVAE